jgi:hypothetical protein
MYTGMKIDISCGEVPRRSTYMYAYSALFFGRSERVFKFLCWIDINAGM